MVFLEAVRELADHLPGFLRVGSEVFLLEFFSEVELPFPFDSSIFSEKVSSGFFEGLLEFRGPFFHVFFCASFLLEISSIRVCSDDENQSGLGIIGCSTASLAALVIWFSKIWSSSSLVDSAAVFRSRFSKNSETFL